MCQIQVNFKMEFLSEIDSSLSKPLGKNTENSNSAIENVQCFGAADCFNCFFLQQ